MVPERLAPAYSSQARSAEFGTQQRDSCVLSLDDARLLLEAGVSAPALQVWLAGAILQVECGEVASQNAVARRAGVARATTQRSLDELERAGFVSRATTGGGVAARYQFSTGTPHATAQPAHQRAGSRVAQPNLPTSGQVPHTYSTPRGVQGVHSAAQAGKELTEFDAVVVRLMAIPDWMRRASSENRFRKTRELVASYTRRWSLSTVSLWIEISASSELAPSLRSRAAWLIEMLREYGRGRTPTGLRGVPLKWQECILAGDLEGARQCLRQRQIFVARERVATEKEYEREALQGFKQALTEDQELRHEVAGLAASWRSS